MSRDLRIDGCLRNRAKLMCFSTPTTSTYCTRWQVELIQPLPDAVRIGVTAVAVGALLFSVYWSKRGSMAETIEHELGYHTTEAVDEYAPVGGKGGQ
jgi:hypothetical protein